MVKKMETTQKMNPVPERYKENEILQVKENANNIEGVRRALEISQDHDEENERYFFHYTSIPVLFDILENDSMWISNTRFSNDNTEERMLGLQSEKEYDDYMACFCDKGDQLSQWRGYCFNGGASIEFELNSPQQYSILHSDYEKSGEYELVYNTPIRVIYISEKQVKEALETISVTCNYDKDKIEKTVPYWKNDKFEEESESRLVFSNRDGRFSKCIRFRTLKNGAKVPYMIMKMGDIGLFSRNCQSDKIDLGYLHELYERGGRYIMIPEGNNQEKLFNETNEVVKEYNKRFSKKASYMRIYCAGHLAVKEIRLAPTYDRERLMEKVKRFCQSKYWLKNVEVSFSEIPYIPPSE